MNKIWTSRRVASDGSVTSILRFSASSELPDSGSRGPLFPAAGLRDIRTSAIPNSVTP